MQRFEDLLRLANEARNRIREISPEEAYQLSQSGAVLIDVRDQKEYKTGHISGAIQVSRDTLENYIFELVPDMSQSIVCYCTLGHRSALAADVLQQLGYLSVSSIAGGLKAYLASSSEHKLAS